MTPGGHGHGGHSHGGHGHGGHSHGGHGHGVEVSRGFVAQARPESSEAVALERGAGRGLTLYLDCASGVAGDMTIASLLDLGVPRQVVDDVIDSLRLDGVRLVVESGYAGSIGCLHVDVEVEERQPDRRYSEIERLLQSSSLDARVEAVARAIFLRLAEAEAQVHRTTLQDVQFHEVGAVDALVDIVGAAACFDYLGADVEVSPLPLGRGFVECQHGRIPLPAPATLLCLEGVPTVATELESELVTPTGAAIVATVATRFRGWPGLTPHRVGWGAGTRGLPDRPNAMRAILGSPSPRAAQATSHVVLEANVDDMSGELCSHVIALAIELGALDAWASPITMKKGRPGLTLGVLTECGRAEEFSALILRESTSLGVRQSLVSRTVLPRRVETQETPWGPVRVKVSGAGGETVKPELDDCLTIAREHNLPLRDVIAQVLHLWSAR